MGCGVHGLAMGRPSTAARPWLPCVRLHFYDNTCLHSACGHGMQASWGRLGFPELTCPTGTGYLSTYRPAIHISPIVPEAPYVACGKVPSELGVAYFVSSENTWQKLDQSQPAVPAYMPSLRLGSFTINPSQYFRGFIAYSDASFLPQIQPFDLGVTANFYDPTYRGSSPIAAMGAPATEVVDMEVAGGFNAAVVAALATGGSSPGLLVLSIPPFYDRTWVPYGFGSPPLLQRSIVSVTSVDLQTVLSKDQVWVAATVVQSDGAQSIVVLTWRQRDPTSAAGWEQAFFFETTPVGSSQLATVSLALKPEDGKDDSEWTPHVAFCNDVSQGQGPGPQSAITVFSVDPATLQLDSVLANDNSQGERCQRGGRAPRATSWRRAPDSCDVPPGASRCVDHHVVSCMEALPPAPLPQATSPSPALVLQGCCGLPGPRCSWDTCSLTSAATPLACQNTRGPALMAAAGVPSRSRPPQSPRFFHESRSFPGPPWPSLRGMIGSTWRFCILWAIPPARCWCCSTPVMGQRQ